MTMMKYRLAIALLWGIGFTSLLCLLMNLNWFFGFLLFPGGLVVSFLSWLKLKDMVLLFAANVLIYSMGAFVVVALQSRKAGLAQLRRIAGWSVLPVTVVAVLACFPSMNPLFPHGMTELAKQESELQAAIPLGVSLEQARGVLNSRKIQFNEYVDQYGGLVLSDREATMTAQSGDTVLAGRFQTEAFKFPCGYDMRIILLFGRDRNLRQQYIHRFMTCP